MTNLNNGEIIDELAILCSNENFFLVKPRAEELFRNYDRAIETIPIEIFVLSLRTQFRKEALINFYSLSPGITFYDLYRDTIHYYQNSISAAVYFEMLRSVFNITLTEEMIRDTISFIKSPIPLPASQPDSKTSEERESKPIINNNDDDDDNGNAEYEEPAVIEQTIFPGLNEIRTVIDEDERNQVQTKNDLMSGPGINAILSYLTDKLDAISDFAETPPYIREFDIDVSQLPSLKPKEINLYMSAEEMAEVLVNLNELTTDEFSIEVSQISRNNYSDEESYEAARKAFIKQKLIERLRKFTFDQMSELASKFQVTQKEIETIQDDVNLYRVFGPVNAYPNTDFSELVTNTDNEGSGEENGEPDENKIYGGARMFLDTILEYDDNDEEHLEDWFTGVCAQCHLRIAHKHYAVRRPLITGGWLGCLCSWDCVRDYVEENFISEEDEESDDDDDGTMRKKNLRNLIQTEIAFINKFDEQMNRVGIADREDENKEPEEQAFQVNPQEVTELSRHLDATLGVHLKFDLPELNPIEDRGEENTDGEDTSESGGYDD